MSLEDIKQILGIEDLPGGEDLLLIALTHSSCIGDSEVPHCKSFSECNERLEFLGDAIWGAAITEYLYQHFPAAREGEMTRAKASLVSRQVLAEKAIQLNLSQHLLLGKSERAVNGNYNPSILANVLESLVGAVYLLAGWLRARALVWRLMATEINRAMEGELDQNYKSKLQELLQGKSKPLPNYQILRTEGPDHQKTFLVEVSLGDKPIGKGEGKSKKCAQQAAAKAALQFLLSHPEILNE